MKDFKKTNKETKQIVIMNFHNAKHIVWNKRRRFGL
jgi:hypothetical protein